MTALCAVWTAIGSAAAATGSRPFATAPEVIRPREYQRGRSALIAANLLAEGAADLLAVLNASRSHLAQQTRH